MRVFLSGPMGAGKSTAGRLVAARLGVPFVDVDRRVVKESGKSIAEIFKEQGEAAFRARERAAALSVATGDDAVVALGGGTVVDPEVRRALLDAGTLVTLTAPLKTLAMRIGDDRNRPMLEGGATRFREILAARAPAYAECHGEVPTGGRSPDAVAEAVVALVRDERVPVPLGLRSYSVEIGEGIRHRLGERVRRASGLVLVADENTAPYRDEHPLEAAVRVTLAAGESNKTLAAVQEIWERAIKGGFDRRAMIVAVGGGVVGDLAGFAAATCLRGLDFGQVPTSLLAMVDSSVGGKTGINYAGAKNMVGAFHQPRFVLCDVETLETLPVAERIAGLGEVLKAAWIDGEEAVAALEGDAEALRAGDAAATTRAIRRSVALKARVVRDDEREKGRRRVLNLGHTIGHGLEAAAGFGSLRHGEAVGLGMLAAARLGGRGEVEERMTALLGRLGLPTDLDALLTPEVFALAAHDKKREGNAVRFLVPGMPGEVAEERIALADIPGRVAR